jgi:hypothetical protein
VTTTEESKANGLYLNRINWFYFYRINPEGTVRQNAIIYDSIAAPNGLTDYTCVPGEDPCPFDTILFSQFYDRAGIGIVLGEGEATCQFGQSGFDNDIFTFTGEGPAVTPSPDSSSSPSPVSNIQTDPPIATTPPRSTPVPQSAPPLTPSPVADIETDPPITTTSPPLSTPAPQGATTPAPQSAPQPDFPDAGAYPTPAPCIGPGCYILNCGTEARVLYESNDEEPLPSGAIVIDEQAADGTAVTFTVTQLWKDDDSISWIAILYPDHTEGNNVCPKFEEVGFQDSFQHTATCFDQCASNVHVYIEIYVHDGSFGPKSETYVPEDCKPSQDTGKKIAYEIFIPCAPCASSRMLSEDTVLSYPLIGGFGGEDLHKTPEGDNQVVSRSNNAHDEFANKLLKKPVPGARLAKMLVERQRQRKLQQEEALPPSPFELAFSIYSADGVENSSARGAVGRSLPFLLMTVAAATFAAAALGTIG